MEEKRDADLGEVVFFAPTQPHQVRTVMHEYGPRRVALVLSPGRMDLLSVAVRSGALAFVEHVPDASLAAAIAAKLARDEPHVAEGFAASFLLLARECAGNARGSLDLTARERGILELVSVGEANRAIAARLFLSEHTVRNHLARIFRKLDVTNRDEAVQAMRDAEGEVG